MFQDFALQHGLIIDSLVLDQWVRVKTVDKPHKKNGAYIFDGKFGAIINFALHEHHISYKEDGYTFTPQDKIKREKATEDRTKRQEEAKRKAIFILNSSKILPHPYLERKGFTEKGYVYKDLLVVPMRVDKSLVGCQMIDSEGNKRFLSGQVTKGASLVIDNKGRDILCEGYATGLSIRRALKSLKMRYKIHICFSASNMVEIAKHTTNPLVVADNDPVGVSAAKKIASVYWLGEAGEDFNDAEKRLGTEAVAELLKPLV